MSGDSSADELFERVVAGDDSLLERLVLERTSTARTLIVDVEFLRRASDVLSVHGSDGAVRITSTLDDSTLALLLRELGTAVELLAENTTENSNEPNGGRA